MFSTMGSILETATAATPNSRPPIPGSELNEDRDIYFAPSVCCFFFLHLRLHPGFDNLFFVAEDLFFGDGFLLLFIIFVADLD